MAVLGKVYLPTYDQLALWGTLALLVLLLFIRARRRRYQGTERARTLIKIPEVHTDLLADILQATKPLAEVTFTTHSMAFCIKEVLEEYPLTPDQKTKLYRDLGQDFKVRLAYPYFKYMLYTLLNSIYEQEKTPEVSIALTKQQVHLQSEQVVSLSEAALMPCRYIMLVFGGALHYKLKQEEGPATEVILQFPPLLEP